MSEPRDQITASEVIKRVRRLTLPSILAMRALDQELVRAELERLLAAHAAEAARIAELEAALDAADLLMAKFIESKLPADEWSAWRRQHRAALCEAAPAVSSPEEGSAVQCSERAAAGNGDAPLTTPNR